MSGQSPLHIRRFGSGLTPVIAVHCSLGHGGYWRAVAACHAADVTFLAPDLPGHGKSPAWDGRQEYQLACVDAVMPILSQPVDLVGHSFGATVALRIAVDHPDLVRSVTLVEPVFFAAAKLDYPSVLDAHLEAAQPYLQAMEHRDFQTASRLFNRLWGDGTKWDDISEASRQYMSDRMYLVAAQSSSIFEDCHMLLAPGQLSRAVMPVSLARGSLSPDVIKPIHEALAARLPDATCSVIEGAGHMAPLTHPAEVSQAIQRASEMAEKTINIRHGNGPVADKSGG